MKTKTPHAYSFPKPNIPIVFLLITLTGLPVILQRFLSPNRPIAAKVLIVEGWIPQHAFRTAKAIFEDGSYDLLITTGGPLPYSSPYQNLADYAAGVFTKMGISTQKIIPVPAPGVDIDRTWISAVAVKTWLDKNSRKETSFNLVSLGPHSRRSWLTYQKVFGNRRKVGVISIPAVYTPKKWWYTRRGYRVLAAEFISYLGFKMLH